MMKAWQLMIKISTLEEVMQNMCLNLFMGIIALKYTLNTLALVSYLTVVAMEVLIKYCINSFSQVYKFI